MTFAARLALALAQPGAVPVGGGRRRSFFADLITTTA